eukprot:gnl/MRDRNA2_/MRDRNA2_100532_c0_seq1.p1 gnl/MRDRNA2_/MRDRNA2_100532_c0~~gnl/MRDRNA2_/MRDRNA2_100532_c0_seq1.p1  ORF type:complete len:319 (-),score=75.82 gnl/MRDRNA2_/MRDRNA2_100532_c0_seq1:81-1037(-)
MARFVMCLLLPALAAAGRHGGIRGLYTAPKVPNTIELHSNATGVATAAKVQNVATAPQSHVLRICNAHPKATLNVHVVVGQTKSALATGLAWQQCGEYVQTLSAGDYLEFDTGGKPVIVPSIPVADTKALFIAYDKGEQASLLQAPKANSTNATEKVGAPAAAPAAAPGAAPAAAATPAPTFNVWYHYYEKLVNSQVAVIDVAPPGATLSGPAASKLVCTGGQCGAGKVEVIPTGEVEPLFPGTYKMTVGQEPTQLNLDLVAGECYAVLRMGKDTLVVYPPVSAQAASFHAKPQSQSGAASAAYWASLLFAFAFSHQF